MMKTLIEYDYEPADYVTLIVYYQSFKSKMTPLNLFTIFRIIL